MSEESKYRDNENTRPCPTCRMPVSVLAVKCRFCGAEMGRPKEATRSLSVEDLGGETVVRYAPSSNVMDALESFRNEETSPADAAQSKQKESLFARKGRKPKGGETKTSSASDLPELDEKSRALASLAMPRSKGPSKPVQRYTASDFVRYGAIALGICIVLYLAIFQVPGWIAAMNAPPPNTFESRYPLLKERNAPPIELLDAAVEANTQAPNEEHAQHLEEAREAVTAEVTGLLNARDWNPNMLAEASDIAQDAADTDHSKAMQDLKAMVDEESRLYRMFLVSVDADAKEATFEVVHPTKGEETYTVTTGDTFADRFEVRSIQANRVRIVDTERGNRSFTAKAPMGRLESS